MQYASGDLLGVHLKVHRGIEALNVSTLGTSGRGGRHCYISRQKAGWAPPPHLHGRDILILPS